MYNKKEGQFHCVSCSFVTINVNTIRSHVQAHKEIKCEHCGNSFTRTSALIVHRKSCKVDTQIKPPMQHINSPYLHYAPNYQLPPFVNFPSPPFASIPMQSPVNYSMQPFANYPLQSPANYPMHSTPLSGINYSQYPVASSNFAMPTQIYADSGISLIPMSPIPDISSQRDDTLPVAKKMIFLGDSDESLVVVPHQGDISVNSTTDDKLIDFYNIISKVKAGKQQKLYILMEKSELHHQNYDMEQFIPLFVLSLQSVKHQVDDYHMKSLERVTSVMNALNHKHFVGVNPTRWYDKFPILRYVISLKYSRFVEKNKVTKEDFESGKIGKDKRYQEVHQLQSCISVFFMVVMILNNYDSIDSFTECDMFNLSYVLFFLKLYEVSRELKTTRRQKEQIFWIFQKIFLMIQQSLYFLNIKEGELRYLERVKLRIDAYKKMLTDKFPHIDKFNPKLYPELLSKGSMITYNEEIAVTMWLIKNLDNMLDIWDKYDKDKITNLKASDNQKKSKKFSRKLFDDLLRDTQTIIGAILLLYLYGQRSQISNSLTVNSIFYQDSVGLVLTPMQEKIRRKSSGIPLNNDLLPILHYQIHVVRKKCKTLQNVKSLFLKSNGTPYNSNYWSKLISNMVKIFNPDLCISGSASFRRGLFSFSQFNETKEINLVRQLYNVRSSTGHQYYKRSTDINEMRQLQEKTHQHVENNCVIKNYLTQLNKTINEKELPRIDVPPPIQQVTRMTIVPVNKVAEPEKHYEFLGLPALPMIESVVSGNNDELVVHHGNITKVINVSQLMIYKLDVLGNLIRCDAIDHQMMSPSKRKREGNDSTELQSPKVVKSKFKSTPQTEFRYQEIYQTTKSTLETPICLEDFECIDVDCYVTESGSPLESAVDLPIVVDCESVIPDLVGSFYICPGDCMEMLQIGVKYCPTCGRRVTFSLSPNLKQINLRPK